MGVAPHGRTELDVARVRRWCDERVPDTVRDQVRVECEVAARHLTIVECRPPWREDDMGTDGRGSRSRGSGTGRAAAAGRCTGVTAAFASTYATVWRPHPVSRSYCRRSSEIRQRSYGGGTGAQATMAWVNGRSAAEADGSSIEPNQDADRRLRSGWSAPEAVLDVLGHSVPVRTGRSPGSVTGSRRVALFQWRQRPGRTGLRAGHHVCCEALRSPPPGLR